MDRLLQLQLVFNTLLVVFNQLPLIQGHRLHRRGQDLGMQARGAAEQQSSCHSDGRGSLLYLNRCKVCHSASRWSQHTGCDRPPKNTNLPGGTLLAVKGFTPAEDHHVCVCVLHRRSVVIMVSTHLTTPRGLKQGERVCAWAVRPTRGPLPATCSLILGGLGEGLVLPFFKDWGKSQGKSSTTRFGSGLQLACVGVRHIGSRIQD